MADDPDIPWLEKYKREGEKDEKAKRVSVSPGNMNSIGELPLFIWIRLEQIHGEEIHLKVSEHIRICQNLSGSVRIRMHQNISESSEISRLLKYL